MRYPSLTLALGVLASGVLIGQQSAAAAPEAITAHCSWALPAKVVLNAPKPVLWIKKGADCPKTAWTAQWTGATSNGGIVSISGFGSDGGGWLHVVDTPVGMPVTWTGDYAYDVNDRRVATLRSATTLTKCGAAVQLTGVRKGTRTTLTARSTYYSTKTKTFVRHHGRVLFQKRDVGSTTWTDLAYADPNSSGVATYTITTNRSRDYRVYVPSSNTVWYAYSATKRV